MELEEWIDINILSTGRRLFALEQMRLVVQAMGGHEDLVQRIAEAMTHDHQTREVDGLWSGVRSGNLEAAGMGPLDSSLDKVISAVRDGAEAQRQGAAPEDPIHKIVDDFLKAVMPAGVFAITSLPYVDELSEAEKLLLKLQGPLAATVVELGLARPVARLAEIVPLYRAALQSAGAKAVDFALVRESRQRGRRYLLEVIVMVLGRYNRADDPAHKAARAALLAPIQKQCEAARTLRSRRGGSGAAPGTDEPELPEIPPGNTLPDEPVTAPGLT
jgi:hypothetical protein